MIEFAKGERGTGDHVTIRDHRGNYSTVMTQQNLGGVRAVTSA